MTFTRVVVLGLGLLTAVAGCGDDGGGGDGTPDACAGATGCGEVCELGNSFGVGQYCTPGGGECANTPNRMAPFCTVDNNPDAPAFCTRPCDPDMPAEPQCGEDAECLNEGGSGPSGCFPIICS